MPRQQLPWTFLRFMNGTEDRQQEWLIALERFSDGNALMTPRYGT
jgi:hypothetical protein